MYIPSELITTLVSLWTLISRNRYHRFDIARYLKALALYAEWYFERSLSELLPLRASALTSPSGGNSSPSMDATEGMPYWWPQSASFQSPIEGINEQHRPDFGEMTDISVLRNTEHSYVMAATSNRQRVVAKLYPSQPDQMLACLKELGDAGGVLRVIDHFATRHHGYVCVFPWYPGGKALPENIVPQTSYIKKLYEVIDETPIANLDNHSRY